MTERGYVSPSDCADIRRLRRQGFSVELVRRKLDLDVCADAVTNHALGRCLCPVDVDPLDPAPPGERNTDPSVPALEDADGE